MTARAEQKVSGRAASSKTERLGEYLFRKGLVSEAEIDAALLLQQQDGEKLGECLFDVLGVRSEGLPEAIAEYLGTQCARPDTETISSNILSMVSARLAVHYRVVPLDVTEGILHVATPDPTDRSLLDELSVLTDMPVRTSFCMRRHLLEGIKKHYGVGAETLERLSDVSEVSAEIEGGEYFGEGPEDEASLIRFVNQVIGEAHRAGATDIHFEPGQDTFLIRYRVDGLLQEVPVAPTLKRFQQDIVSRIKVMARLDIAEQRLPQDGRIQFRSGGETFDLRVSILPTPLGEAVNVRLLKRSGLILDLEVLGFDGEARLELERAARRTTGILLVTGPTGSGKTTTLYSLLTQIASPEVKVVTIEDPIEYRVPGILQMQTQDEVGFTFARALRSILRHDPDVALVGEIRDQETAEIAIRMAMTGHLVLSTLHTNDASSTIARLLDMGLEPYLLATTLNCVIAQRLVRRLCEDCKRPLEGAALEEARAVMPKRQISSSPYGGVGCEACRMSGYAGRIAIHEIVTLEESWHELIMNRSDAGELRRHAASLGIRSMFDSGWDLVSRGSTAVEEVLRVSGSWST